MREGMCNSCLGVPRLTGHIQTMSEEHKDKHVEEEEEDDEVCARCRVGAYNSKWHHQMITNLF